MSKKTMLTIILAAVCVLLIVVALIIGLNSEIISNYKYPGKPDKETTGTVEQTEDTATDGSEEATAEATAEATEGNKAPAAQGGNTDSTAGSNTDTTTGNSDADVVVTIPPATEGGVEDFGGSTDSTTGNGPSDTTQPSVDSNYEFKVDLDELLGDKPAG